MREAQHLLLAISAVLLVSAISGDVVEEESKQRLISTFQIVRFPNDACTASTTRNGTCYTSAECSDKGGTSSGSCADGFGVCCQFVINTCGSTSSENVTYWDAPTTVETGGCSLTICPINDNICQLRIDFSTFVITGPSTVSVSEANSLSAFINIKATANTGAGGGASWATNCLADRFSVSSQAQSAKQPEICGTNTGLHMYIEADQECNELNFDFSSGVATTITDSDTVGVLTTATRDWDMTVYQYECGYINQAPVGCTQYLWGPTTGYITTYNYAGATKHLADQNQRVCIRRERGVCYTCFYIGTSGAFSFAGINDNDNYRVDPALPCGRSCDESGLGTGVGAAGVACSYDCAIIPGLFAVTTSITGATIAAANAAQVRLNTAAAFHGPVGPQISSGGAFGTQAINVGTIAGIISAGINTAQTLCTRHEPYMLIFRSDNMEGNGLDGDQALITTNTNNQRGINLNYATITCT